MIYKPDKKDLSKPPLYMEGYTKVQNAYTSITIPDPIDPTLRCTYQKPTKLNYTQRIGFKKYE